MTPLPEPVICNKHYEMLYFTEEQLQSYGAARFNEALELAAQTALNGIGLTTVSTADAIRALKLKEIAE
jgi:hypothetical protein